VNRLLLASLVAASLGACGADDPDTSSTLIIENDSSYTLLEINLSPTTSASWGPDLLGNTVLAPGDTFEVSGIQCDTYDIRVVDEDLDPCILHAVDLCLDNAVWRIDDVELATCGF
jgi:hypothetical protein